MSNNGDVRTSMGNWKYLKELRELCRINRKNPTESEERLWDNYLKFRPLGFKFLRQKPIDRFILDFYCSKLLMVIELDGLIHKKQYNRDKGRDEMLSRLNIMTLRISNDRVDNKLSDVKKEIELVIGKRIFELSLLFQGRELKGGFR